MRSPAQPRVIPPATGPTKIKNKNQNPKTAGARALEVKEALRLGFPAPDHPSKFKATCWGPRFENAREPSLAQGDIKKHTRKNQKQPSIVSGGEVAGREVVGASVGVEGAVGYFGEEAQFGGEVGSQRAGLVAPTPVAVAAAGSVHACIAVETKNVLNGNDAEIGE